VSGAHDAGTVNSGWGNRGVEDDVDEQMTTGIFDVDSGADPGAGRLVAAF
jgi:hypothetical protein